MKLSMWILLDKLRDLEPDATIADGQRVLEGFRILSDAKTVSDKYVYLSAGPEPGAALKLTHGRDTIFLRSADLYQTVNRLSSIFEDYHTWECRILEAVQNSDTPLQSIMDLAHEKFQSPMLFGSIDRHIYALTAQYSKDEVYEEWDLVKELHSMPFALNERLGKEFFTTYKDISLKQESDQAIEPVWEGMHFCHQIRTNCYLNDSIWGHFYIYYKKEYVSPGVLQLARYIGDIYEELIKKHAEKTTPQYFKYSWLIDVLNGIQPNVDAIKSLYRSLDWNTEEELILFRIDTHNTDYDRMMFYWLCDSVDSLSNAIVFPYSRTIVAVVRNDGKQADYVLSGIKRLISFNYYHCGASFPFRGLHKIATFYRQAGYAMDYAPDAGGKAHFFRDCALEGVIEEFCTTVKGRTEWVLPSLLAMVEQDRKSGKEYAATLHQYLLNGNSITETAAAMHIHRNTLVYRLDKIRQLLEIPLDGNMARLYLLLCFILLDKQKTERAPLETE